MNDVPEKLEQINDTLKSILKVMNKPENPFLRGLTIAGSGVSALGFIHLIDVIKSWLGV